MDVVLDDEGSVGVTPGTLVELVPVGTGTPGASPVVSVPTPTPGAVLLGISHEFGMESSEAVEHPAASNHVGALQAMTVRG